MYGTPGSTGDNAYTLTHSNDKPSTIKTALDSWYANTFTSKEGSLIADNGFCNDRSIASTANAWASGDTALGYGNNTTYYGAYNRVNNLKAPNLGCNKGDLFTTTANPNGNQALQYPIGLLTLDEVWYAGLAPRSGNGSYNYLLNGESFVLMTPEKYFVEDGMYSGVAAVYIVQDISGMEPTVTSIPVTSTTLDKDTCLRPVINLKSTTTVSGGDGTEGSPFKVNVG